MVFLLEPFYFKKKMYTYLKTLSEKVFIQAMHKMAKVIQLSRILTVPGWKLDFFQSQIILRSKVLCHHFYLPKVIIQVQTGLEDSEG